MNEHRTLAELASLFGVHASQIAAWKEELKDSAAAALAGKRELLNEEPVETAKQPLCGPARRLKQGWQVAPYLAPMVPF